MMDASKSPSLPLFPPLASAWHDEDCPAQSSSKSLNVISDDALQIVFSFVRTRSCGPVCRRWCDHLHLKYLCSLSFPDVPPDAVLMKAIQRGVVSAKFSPIPLTNMRLYSILTAMVQSKTLSSLEIYGVWESDITDRTCDLVGSLRNMVSLNRLRLSFLSTRFSDAGVSKLMKFAHAPNLTDLSISFYSCRLQAEDLKSIASLQSNPKINRLTLNLGNNSLADEGVDSIVHLCQSPYLSVMDLNFRDNAELTHRGMRVFQSLTTTCFLSELTLDLSRVGCPFMAVETVTMLGHLKHSESLQSLCLRMKHNNIGVDGVRHFMMSRGRPIKLKSLNLDFSGNSIGDEGVRCICALKDADSLTSLSLTLRENGISHAGAKYLSILKQNRNLRKLSFDLRQNVIIREGARLLWNDVDVPDHMEYDLDVADQISDSWLKV